MRRRAATLVLLGLVAVLVAAAGWVVWRNLPADQGDARTAAVAAPALVARGEYLARAGNCAGCHTPQGGPAYAGGRPIETPFGRVYAPNLTPDADTGIGRWSAADFWRALHEGRSRDGRLLNPAFPYPNYTLLTREDSDAMFAFLRSLPPVRRTSRPHELRFPYDSQAALAVWRALSFSPREFVPERGRSAAWNRGSYLVNGLGHCTACHARRNARGAAVGRGGALLPDGRWYAPSLYAPHEAGAMGRPLESLVALLRDGIAADATAMGPMAEVVYNSTQYLEVSDLRAMAEYLASLPADAAPVRTLPATDRRILGAGRRLYARHCAECHGRRGQGKPGMYPALAGNRAVTMPTPQNVVQAILRGGFPPTTAGNPRPYGMPPYLQVLKPRELAAVATFVRHAWGNGASAVSVFEVEQAR